MRHSNGMDPQPTDGKYQKGSPEYREMHTRLGLLAIAVIINVLGFSVIFPLVPYYIQHALGPNTSPYDSRIALYGGWLTSIYALMQFFFAPIWGRLSDRVGRKPILMASLVGDVIFYTMFGLSHSLTMLFAARVLAGIFSSASLAVAQAYAADVTPPDHRAAGLGMIGASFGIGFVFGPALGGALGKYSLALPLFVSAGLAFVNLLFIAKYLPEPPRAPETVGKESAPVLASRISAMGKALSGPIGFLYILTFAVTFAFANLEGSFTTYLMQHFHYTKQSSIPVQGWVFTYIGFLLVLVQGGAIRPLVKRYGEVPLVITGIGLMAIGFFLFPLAPHLWLLLIGPMIPISIGNGLNSPSLRALVSRKAAANMQGTTLGLSASFDSLARAAGPATAGWLYTRYGQGAPYWCAGVVMTIAFVFAWLKKSEMLPTDSAPLAAGPGMSNPTESSAH